jgi:hypothetical protein
MRLHQLAEALDLRELTPRVNDDVEITHGYVSDLLSDILAHAPAGGVLVTLQVNLDVLAVAGLAGQRAVIFSSDRTPQDDIVARFTADRISLFQSQADSFEVVGRLHDLGLQGRQGPYDGHAPSLRGHGQRHPFEAGRPGALPLTLQIGG